MRWVEAVAPAQQINSDERIYEAWGKLAKDLSQNLSLIN